MLLFPLFALLLENYLGAWGRVDHFSLSSGPGEVGANRILHGLIGGEYFTALRASKSTMTRKACLMS